MSDILGIVLAIIAFVLKIIFAFPLYIYGFYKAAKGKELGLYHSEIGRAWDRYGNVIGQFAFNDFLITNDGYKAGNGKETISSFIGKNKFKNTFTLLGKYISRMLNRIQKDHVEKAIDDKV